MRRHAAVGANTDDSAIKVTEFENGLDIVLSLLKYTVICLTFKAGGMTEASELNGLTHLWEHMFFKGNKNTNPKGSEEELDG